MRDPFPVAGSKDGIFLSRRSFHPLVRHALEVLGFKARCQVQTRLENGKVRAMFDQEQIATSSFGLTELGRPQEDGVTVVEKRDC